MEPTPDETDHQDAASGPTRMQPIQRRPGSKPGGMAPSTLASDRERDAVLQRLRDAFAEGRLNDTEFDGRMRTALTARTHGDLDQLLTDLPASAAPSAGARPAASRPGRFAIALKGSVRRAGRWRVPEHYMTVVYKGHGQLDLRAAEISAVLTTIVAVAYKSGIEILVSPGIHVQVTGSVTQGEVDLSTPIPPDAPTLNIRGFAYKGTIEVSTKPRDTRSR